MQTELSVTIVRVGDHLEIRQDGLMVAKREAIQNILNNGEIELKNRIGVFINYNIF